MKTKTAQHTPGPWKIRTRHKNGLITIAQANTQDDYGICDVRPDDHSGLAEADARLIATAPELLEILKFALTRIELANAEGNPILSAFVPDMKVAINKAEGNGQAK